MSARPVRDHEQPFNALEPCRYTNASACVIPHGPTGHEAELADDHRLAEVTVTGHCVTYRVRHFTTALSTII